MSNTRICRKCQILRFNRISACHATDPPTIFRQRTTTRYGDLNKYLNVMIQIPTTYRQRTAIDTCDLAESLHVMIQIRVVRTKDDNKKCDLTASLKNVIQIYGVPTEDADPNIVRWLRGD